MNGEPIIWQQELADISTPDGGDTYHVRITIGGQPLELAMSRQVYIAQVMRAIDALAGPEDRDDLALLTGRIAHQRRPNR